MGGWVVLVGGGFQGCAGNTQKGKNSRLDRKMRKEIKKKKEKKMKLLNYAILPFPTAAS